jgi:hypothetical protein
MNISIYNIKVNSITNIGSLNIGKTILCRNQTTEVTSPKEESPVSSTVTDLSVTPPTPEVSVSPQTP